MSDDQLDDGLLAESSYHTYFIFGEAALTKGKLRDALASFQVARSRLDPTGEDRITTAEVEQQMGICHRLIAQRRRRPFEDKTAFETSRALHISASFEAFVTAFTLAHNDGMRRLACVLRDFGMLFMVDEAFSVLKENMEQSSIPLLQTLSGLNDGLACADHLFDLSYHVLRKLSSASEGASEDELEAWTSWGFRARPMLARGNRWRASELLRQADTHLQGKNPVYEINNLAWLQKSETLPERIGLWKRGMNLAWHTRNPKRALQFTVQTALPSAFS